MSRSKWKGPYIHYKFLKKKNLNINSFINIWSRNSVILSNFIGYKFLIHSGNTFKKFFITREKIGFKFGEFCTTRSKYFHKNKLKGNKNKSFKNSKKK
jgi:small subunit ribosomal protein S19